MEPAPSIPLETHSAGALLNAFSLMIIEETGRLMLLAA